MELYWPSRDRSRIKKYGFKGITLLHPRRSAVVRSPVPYKVHAYNCQSTGSYEPNCKN